MFFRLAPLNGGFWFDSKIVIKWVLWVLFVMNIFGLLFLEDRGLCIFFLHVGVAGCFMVKELDGISRALGVGIPVVRLNVALLISVSSMTVRFIFVDYVAMVIPINWAVLLCSRSAECLVWLLCIWRTVLDKNIGAASIFSRLSHTLLSIFCVMVLIASMDLILGVNYLGVDGVYWLAYVLFISKCSDLGGMFFGKAFGQRFMSYSDGYLHLGKTLEGYVGCAVFSVLGSIIAGYHFIQLGVQLDMLSFAILGLGLSVLCIYGDILESILKRSNGDFVLHRNGSFVLDFLDSLWVLCPLCALGMCLSS